MLSKRQQKKIDREARRIMRDPEKRLPQEHLGVVEDFERYSNRLRERLRLQADEAPPPDPSEPSASS